MKTTFVERVGTVTGNAGPATSARWALGTSIANVALPTLSQVFHAPFQDVQWVVLAYLLASTTLIVSVGRLGDLTGRRRLPLFGTLLFTLACVSCSVAPSLGWLLAARAAQGLGAAIMLALALAFVGETVPKAQAGRAMGLLGAMSAVGTALGPSLGGALIPSFGWRAIFLVLVPLGLLTFLLAYRSLPGQRPEPGTDRPHFDGAGTVLLSLALAAYALAMTTGRGHVGPLNLTLMGAAVLGGGLFVFAERRSAFPLVQLELFDDRALSFGLIGMAAGCAALSILPVRSGLVGYVAPLLVITGSYALFQTANNAAVMAQARPDQRGVVSGLLSLSRNLGPITGASGMGAVFALAAATGGVTLASPASVASGMQVTFAVAAALMAVALAAAVGRRAHR